LENFAYGGMTPAHGTLYQMWQEVVCMIYYGTDIGELGRRQ